MIYKSEIQLSVTTKNDLIDTMEILQKEGIYCDWMLEKEGKKGYWLIVEGSEKA